MDGKQTAGPRISIIIVTYNGWQDTTAPCLESIFANSGDLDYEVIVVDNHSTDGTAQYLSELAETEPRLSCVFNGTNRGFAGGNNDGIAAASGQVLVLLNNDTQVGRGWLAGLARALQDESVGLVGPVTNAVGNEQKIFTRGATPGEILAEGERWVGNSRGDIFDTERLGFFCVALRRDLVDRVGVLDEGFGLGFYEDDDYCLRVSAAGYRLVCVEDVFVYHRGSASFGKDRALTRQLLKTNRCILEKKIGRPFRPQHPRKRLLDLVESNLLLAQGNERPRMLLKAANRVELLESMSPRSFFKKIFFNRKMNRIRARIRQVAS